MISYGVLRPLVLTQNFLAMVVMAWVNLANLWRKSIKLSLLTSKTYCNAKKSFGMLCKNFITVLDRKPRPLKTVSCTGRF
jgi:hypothetical protein